YIVKFNCLATQVCGYGEGTLCHMFYNGLPDCIRDEIAHIGKPPWLSALCTLTQTINACYWECKSEVSCQAKPTSMQPWSSLSSNSKSTPSTSSASSSNTSTVKGKKPFCSNSSTTFSSDPSTPDLS